MGGKTVAEMTEDGLADEIVILLGSLVALIGRFAAKTKLTA